MPIKKRIQNIMQAYLLHNVLSTNPFSGKILGKWVAFLLFALLFTPNLIAQEEEIEKQDDYQLIKTIPIEVSLLSTDKLQNVFVVSKKGEVIKYNPKGEQLALFNEFSLGMPGHIDATNPFQILLFYPDLSTVVLLNNTLNKIAEFDLLEFCLLYTSPSPRDLSTSRMPSSA